MHRKKSQEKKSIELEIFWVKNCNFDDFFFWGGGGIFSLAIYCFNESRKFAMLVSFVSVLHMFMIAIIN